MAADKSGKNESDLVAQRCRIDAIDDEIAALLNRRAVAVREIGQWKSATGRPIYDPARERAIVDRITGGNHGPLPDGALRRLFERIIDESRSLERADRDRRRTESTEKRGG